MNKAIALAISLPLLLAVPTASMEEAEDNGGSVPAPVSVIRLTLDPTYEKHQDLKENPQGDRQVVEGERVWARITEYGRTGRTMASGKAPYVGAVAVSDRSIPFGTRVSFDDHIYTIEDRTALWVHEKFGFTIDVYSENPKGRQWKEITIYQ